MSVPAFRLKLDLLKLSKQVRRRPTYPVAPPVVLFEVTPARICHRRSHYVSVPIPPYPRSSLGEGEALCSARRAGRGNAVTPWPRGKAVGDFTACRRSAKVRLGKTSVAKRARLQEAHRVHNAPEDTFERRPGHTEYACRMRPVIPVLRDVAV